MASSNMRRCFLSSSGRDFKSFGRTMIKPPAFVRMLRKWSTVRSCRRVTTQCLDVLHPVKDRASRLIEALRQPGDLINSFTSLQFLKIFIVLSFRVLDMILSLLYYFQREKDNGEPLIDVNAIHDISFRSFLHVF